MTFKPQPGDVVSLRAPGSPAMVVELWEDGGPLQFETGWRCAWTIQGALRRAIFPEAALRLYGAPPAAGGEGKAGDKHG